MNRSKQAGMTKKTAVALLVGLVFGSGCAASGFSRVRGQVLQSDMQTLRWLRMPGDTLFANGNGHSILFVMSDGKNFRDKRISRGRNREKDHE
jgi:nitric oxide reductase large subunit